MLNMSRTPEYASWAEMKRRCLNKNHPRYADYGGRGITVCYKWLKFETFFTDMGLKPKSTSLERINNDKGYSLDNCKWATRFEQASNTRTSVLIAYKGITKCASAWAREIGVSHSTILRRLKANKSSKEILAPKTGNSALYKEMLNHGS